MESYPTIAFLLKYRRMLVILAGLTFPAAGLYLTVRTGYLEPAVAGVVLGVIVYVLIRSYLELVALIADMLLPK